MHFPKLLGIASGLALSSSLAFAWSISGTVKSGSGRALADVQISSFNYPSVTATTDATGAFTISDEGSDAIFGAKIANMSVHMDGNTLTIANINANKLKISVIDALGKVLKQSNLVQVYGFVSFDLGKLAKGARFVRISADSQNSTYMLTNKGVTTLKKEGDPLPSFMFVKDGYQSVTYQMEQEVETNVAITMQRGSATGSSSSVGKPAESSSSEVAQTPSSSSQKVDDTPVDCSSKTLKSNTTLTIGGRKVIVKFPSGYSGDKPTPLLINYHPIMGSASQWEGGSQTAKAALADGAIVAFMDGAQGPMGQAWNVGPCCTDADDVQFTRDFVKEITNKACVDPKRIYAAGFSMGGGMSNYAGCFLADIIAAAAPSAFDLAKEIVDAGKCKPARPYPILNFRGTNDGIVMYNGGLSQVVSGKPITFMGAENNFKEWAKMNGCTGEPKSNTPGNNCKMYENCEGGAKVGLCTIQGGDHAEGDGQMGWNFVKQFSLP